MTTSSMDHSPLESDGIPTASHSQAAIDLDATAALRYLARVGAMDVAEMLGLGDVPC